MSVIRIKASTEYDVNIERGLLDSAGRLIAEALGKKQAAAAIKTECACGTEADKKQEEQGALGTAAVIADDTVFALYGSRVCDSLCKAGFRVVSFTFAPGEQSKSLATYEKILYFLAENHITRSDFLVALGGGITGDITGFAAATYLRGVRFVQIPTTLLAAVDSSVGGKTAINLGTGKNQVGSFYQPALVICDPDTLKTLPEDEYLCGCAEVIKYGILGNEPFFRSLKKTHIKEQEENVIETCVAMKSNIVADDEFDRGKRQLLNLGHTIGHAVEAASDFAVLHGQAVAIGMAVIARAAAAKGFCTAETLDEIIEILNMYGLPSAADFPLADMYSAALADKKVSGKKINLIVPQRIGECIIETTEAENLKDWMRAGGIK